MRHLIIILALLSAVPLIEGIVYSQPPAKETNQRLVAGYKASDCENKCVKDQQCMLRNEDERYYCWTLKTADGSTQKQMEVYIPCDSIGGVRRTKCTSRDFSVVSVLGKNEIPVRTHMQGQCCIPKTKLKIY